MKSNMTKDLIGRISSSPLISAEELKPLLDNPSVKIFDVRGTWSTPERALPEDYAEGHIDGAAFLDWTKYFNEQDVPIGQASIIDQAGAARAFEELGINENDLVVLYDNNSHMQAGRMWIAMRHWGFTNVKVLNGGWKYWSLQEFPSSTESPVLEKGTFKPVQNDGLKYDLDEFIAVNQQSCVIDARGSVGYAGSADDPRTGHIPGSVNLPFSALLDPETGLFLSSETITHKLDEKAPEWREKPIIASCGSGYAATVVLLALSEINVAAKLFDGSFSIWKQDPNRPIEQSYSQ